MKKKGFTLVELLVVVGIIGILMAVLVGAFSSALESARTAKCMTNLKNLAMAAQACDPPAGSYEKMANAQDIAMGNMTKPGAQAYEVKGWISWYSNGKYASAPKDHISSPDWFISCYNQDYEVRNYCLTNGALYAYVQGNKSLYVCPKHLQSGGMKPAWSYVMNSYFGWDETEGTDYSFVQIATFNDPVKKSVVNLAGSDRRLLFAEIQYADIPNGPTVPSRNASSGTQFDPTLQYDKDHKECIGINHGSGKLHFGHIVFADGHTERIVYPEKGLSQHELWELTTWLCDGKDITFNGKRYEEFE